MYAYLLPFAPLSCGLQIHEAVVMSPRPASPGRRPRSPIRPSYYDTPLGTNRSSALGAMLSSAHLSPSVISDAHQQMMLSPNHLIHQTTIMPGQEH